MGEGRPKIMKRAVVLFVRIEEEDRAALARCAEQDGCSVAELARDAVRGYLIGRRAAERGAAKAKHTMADVRLRLPCRCEGND